VKPKKVEPVTGAVVMPQNIEMRNVDDLLPYARNSRTHSPAQVAKIAASIREFGWTVPILVMNDGTVVAGHGRLEAARKLKITEVPTIDVSHLDEAQMRAYVIADNRLALDAGWDEEMLAAEIESLIEQNYEIDLLGFDEKEIDAILADEDDALYTRKVESPLYEPTGPKPALADLWDNSKTVELLTEIEAAEIPDDVKEFLRAAAQRHIVLNFRNIAEYYAHSNQHIQDLMERSALVIIDFNKAIELGYVKLTDAIMQQYRAEYGAIEKNA